MTDTPPAPPPAPQAAPASGPLDPWPQSVTWRRVSPRLIPVELVRLLLRVAVVAVAAVVAGTLGWPYVSQTLAVLGAYAVLRAVAVVRAVRAWGYAERERDLLVRQGVLVRRLSIVPYTRMQFVDVTAGPLERMLGLATVRLHTAAAATDAVVPGLPAEEATRLRDRLTALGTGGEEGL